MNEPPENRGDPGALSSSPTSRDRRRDVGRRTMLRATAGFTLALVVLMLTNVMLGPPETGVTPTGVCTVVLRHLPLPPSLKPPASDETVDAIVWQVRMPRVVTAALVGALLALAGVALQGLLMNPLADPYTVGASAGAAVGAATAEVIGIAALAGGLVGAGVAFVTAISASALVYALARVGGKVSVQTFLLAGVVVGTMLWSMIPLLMVLSGRADDLQRIYFYLIGSLQGADWSRAALLSPFALISLVVLLAFSRELNLMTLGEESAHHLGVNVESFKRLVLAVGALATAAAVSVSGIIGFVGLVVPHIARRFVGPNHLRLLPVAALAGASLLVASDTVVRVWLNDMPVGVITAIVGAPVFCVLVRKRRATSW